MNFAEIIGIVPSLRLSYSEMVSLSMSQIAIQIDILMSGFIFYIGKSFLSLSRTLI